MLRLSRLKSAIKVQLSILWEAAFEEEAGPALYEPDQLDDIRVAVTAPIYQYYPILLNSLQLQTHQNWRLYLVHDGSEDDYVRGILDQQQDERVCYWHTETRYNDWGHSLRNLALNRVAEDGDCNYIVMTNADNYYVPDFLRQMLLGFRSGDAAVYCDMVHSHFNWRLVRSQPRRNSIDCGAVMFPTLPAANVGWNHTSFDADWHFIDEVLRASTGEPRRVRSPLFIHN